MKILKIVVPNGFMMLKKGFTLNFLTKTRVNKKAPNDDLIELEPGLYYPKETAFIGKNSSGKTTVLELVDLCHFILRFGRIKTGPFSDFVGNFKVEITFYNGGFIYEYRGEFAKSGGEFLTIVGEMLGRTKWKAFHGKSLERAGYSNVPKFKASPGMDTSQVVLCSVEPKELNIAGGFPADWALIFNLLCMRLKPDQVESIVTLFDDSIEYIKRPDDVKALNLENTMFLFKRAGKKEVLMDIGALTSRLSAGTVRGIALYGLAALQFRFGGTLIIDEIERSFNKNLIFNLFAMFNDESINKKGATLIYSTHYAEILDDSRRCDNVNVLHRTGGEIDVKNMHLDYKLRTQLKKSEQFDQNAFDNQVNYDALMRLKRSLRG